MNSKETDTDAIVLQLLDKVEEKKKQIGEAERPAWRTNCSFGYDVNSNTRLNIQTIKDLDVLVDIYGFLTEKFERYNKSVKDLKLDKEAPDFKYLGFSFKDWASDIQTRIEGLRIKNKKDELAKLEARVNSLVSPEQRRKIELAKLVEEIE